MRFLIAFGKISPYILAITMPAFVLLIILYGLVFSASSLNSDKSTFIVIPNEANDETLAAVLAENNLVSSEFIGKILITKQKQKLIQPKVIVGGEYEIPAFTFSYFDLSKKQYISKTAGPYTIQVGKGSGNSASVSSGPTEKSEFRMIGNDIRYIKIQEPDFNQGLNSFYGSPLFITLSLCPFILFGGIFFWQQQQNKLAGNTALLKKKNATSVARKRLTAARKLLESKQDAQVMEEIHKALMGYIGDKFLLPLSEMSKERAASLLEEQKVSPDLIQQYLKNIDDCEMARYGGLGSGISAASVYASSEKVISAIEGGVKA